MMTVNPLGKETQYNPHYDKKLLFAIERETGRKNSEIDASIFNGYDVWNCYELSWLNGKGKPEVRRARIVYPSDSRCIVESKSLKLYLGSFIMTKFENEDRVAATISEDLSEVLGAGRVDVKIYGCFHPLDFALIEKDDLVDDLDVSCDSYFPDSSLIEVVERGDFSEALFTNLLKTNCPITSQPDWASVSVKYRASRQMTRESFLRYIVSFREHGDYHEVCCEKIFTDIFRALSPEMLAVKCFYTRRGGIDINPCRFHGIASDEDFSLRYWRQ